MKTEEAALILVAAAAVILILYFVTAKGAAKKLTIGNPDGSSIDVTVEIANNTATRTKGLMGRKTLGEYEGMLFVFDSSARHSFWMFNTTIPLDAIHISENGTIVEVIEMEPCGINCTSYVPQNESKYVLEVNRGFSKRHGIVAGKSRMTLP